MGTITNGLWDAALRFHRSMGDEPVPEISMVDNDRFNATVRLYLRALQSVITDVITGCVPPWEVADIAGERKENALRWADNLRNWTAEDRQRLKTEIDRTTDDFIEAFT